MSGRGVSEFRFVGKNLISMGGKRKIQFGLGDCGNRVGLVFQRRTVLYGALCRPGFGNQEKSVGVGREGVDCANSEKGDRSAPAWRRSEASRRGYHSDHEGG